MLERQKNIKIEKILVFHHIVCTQLEGWSFSTQKKKKKKKEKLEGWKSEMIK